MSGNSVMTTVTAPLAPPTQRVSPSDHVPAVRLASLDVFRGITIAAMILVNNPGDWGNIYPPLKHAAWHGWTPTDLIFPFFLFIVGVAIPFSLTSRMNKLLASGLQPDAAKRKLLPAILRRSAIIFLLGLLLHAVPTGPNSGILALATLRIPGVLQRIAICYLVAAILALYTGWRVYLAAAVALIAVYAALLTTVPVPGHGRGVLREDANLVGYVDQIIFGHHLYKHPPTHNFFFDPEGLLSTMPAIATTLFGALAGAWLRTRRDPFEKVAGLFAAGVVGVIAGYVLDGILMPINKPLWTPSYTIFTAGMALLGLGLCYWLTDIQGYRGWAMPFTIFGLNAIAAFVLSGIVGRLSILIKVPQDGQPMALKTFIFRNFFAPLADPVTASLLFAIAYVLLFLGLMSLLYWRRIAIKV